MSCVSSLPRSRLGAAGTFFMRIGTLTVHDMPCTLLEVEHSTTPQCVSTDTGQAVGNLRHGEYCTPTCTADFDPLVSQLSCSYGQVMGSKQTRVNLR